MAFYRSSGVSDVQPMNSAASTAITPNALVVETAGALALVASTGSLVSGVVLQGRVSTDSDYAIAKPILVDRLGPGTTVYCDTVVGTLTAAMEGQFLKLSSTTGVNADAATATDTPAAGLVLQLVKYVSATAGYFTVNGLKHMRSAN